MSQSGLEKKTSHAQRSAARLAAVQAVYQMGANGQDSGTIVSEYAAYRLGKPVDGEQTALPDRVLFSAIVRGVDERGDDLRHVIDVNLRDHKQVRTGDGDVFVEPLLRAVLLCGSYELLAHHDTDVPVIISDFLNVTHAFYEGGESKLVNGVLDRIAKVLRDAPEGGAE